MVLVNPSLYRHVQSIMQRTVVQREKQKKAQANPMPMKPSLMEIICCPVCKGDLSLLDEKTDKYQEIVTGKLRCAACSTDYPIEDGIPNLLPPEEQPGK